MACRSRSTQILRQVGCPTIQCSRSNPFCPFTRVRWQSTTSTAGTEGAAKGRTGPTKTIKFTSETYPKIKRDSRFTGITEEHVKYFKKVLGQDSAIIDSVTKDSSDDIEPFNSDW